jgi:DNA-binding NtrC family response regulator
VAVDSPASLPTQRAAPPAAEPGRGAHGTSALDEPRLARIGTALGLAPKTVGKLFDPRQLGSIADSELIDRSALRRLASGALLEILFDNDFNQTTVAATLDVSRTTLVKLMADLDLPRAADLTRESIDHACREAQGDVAMAARALRVSPSSLKKRITQLRGSGSTD